MRENGESSCVEWWWITTDTSRGVEVIPQLSRKTRQDIQYLLRNRSWSGEKAGSVVDAEIFSRDFLLTPNKTRQITKPKQVLLYKVSPSNPFSLLSPSSLSDSGKCWRKVFVWLQNRETSLLLGGGLDGWCPNGFNGLTFILVSTFFVHGHGSFCLDRRIQGSRVAG